MDDLQVARALGELTAEMRNSREEMRTFREELKADRKERKEAETAMQGFRAATNKELNAHAQATRELAHGFRDLSARVEHIEPIAEEWSRWRAMGVGALAAVGFIGSALGGLVVFFRDAINNAIRSILG